MSSQKWIMVRVKDSTHAALRRIAAARLENYARGGQPALPDGEQESLDAVVAMLIDAYDRHAARRKASAKRQQKRREECSWQLVYRPVHQQEGGS